MDISLHGFLIGFRSVPICPEFVGFKPNHHGHIVVVLNIEQLFGLSRKFSNRDEACVADGSIKEFPKRLHLGCGLLATVWEL